MRQKIKTITDFFSISLSRFTAARSSLHAAGLTYFTMMSLIPVLCLLLLLARTLGMGEIARNEINRQIDVLITNVEKGQDKDIGVIPLSEEVKKAKDEAEQANAAKSDFLANMSHEIRTPINAVLGMNEMILRESDDANVREYAGKAHNAGKTLLNLINDILDLSKIEAGKMEPLQTEGAKLEPRQLEPVAAPLEARPLEK